MTQSLRIGIAGIGGRMGRETAAVAEADSRVKLVGGLIRPGSRPPELEGLLISDDPDQLLPSIDCLIDLSLPAATPSLAKASARHGVALVCGVTGLEDDAIG